jgi:hypothetical protein
MKLCEEINCLLESLSNTTKHLEANGWKPGYSDYETIHYKHADHPGHKMIVVKPSGGIDHHEPGKEEPKYVSRYDVRKYLKDFHKK